MKKVMMGLVAFWMQGVLFSQSVEKKSDLSYEILIDLVEPINGSSLDMPLSLDLTEKGSYFFKKSEALFIPQNCTAVLEDRLTGNVFDLLSTERHSFSISRPTSREFILRISERKSTGIEITTLAK